MPTDQILSLLIAERDRLNRAIAALDGNQRRRGRPPKTESAIVTAGKTQSANTPRRGRPPYLESIVPRKHKLSAAGRKAIANAARKRWAAIRASEKVGGKK